MSTGDKADKAILKVILWICAIILFAYAYAVFVDPQAFFGKDRDYSKPEIEQTQLGQLPIPPYPYNVQRKINIELFGDPLTYPALLDREGKLVDWDMYKNTYKMTFKDLYYFDHPKEFCKDYPKQCK